MALTGRELNLQEGEAVELIKIGCAGWWWVTFYHDLVILIFGAFFWCIFWCIFAGWWSVTFYHDLVIPIFGEDGGSHW